MALSGAMLIGMSKAGFSGVTLMSVLIFAQLYGSKNSVGLTLPLLLAADLMVYPVFRKYGSWRPVWKLLLPALLGMGFGWWLLGWIGDQTSKQMIGGCVMLMVALQCVRKINPSLLHAWVHVPGVGVLFGSIGGVATMVANAAGPVIQCYLMAKSIPKLELVGIGARFFLLINLIKIPINSRLALIDQVSLIENAKLLPGVLVGIFVGRFLVKRVPQGAFEWVVMVLSTLAGLRLLWN